MAKRRIGPLLVAAALLVSTAGAEPRRFAVAIVRTDGRLVPFASYDGERWEKAWPEPNEGRAVKPTLDAVSSVWHRRGERLPDRWQVWRTGHATPIEARVTGVEVVDAHCQAQVALNTDLPEAKSKRPAHGPTIEGRAGVAVDSTTAPVGAIEKLRPADALWRTAERAIVAGFSRLEAAHAQARGARLPVETPVPAVRVEAVYSQARTLGSPLYFVAEKKYRTAPREPGCTDSTVMTGWLVPTDAGTLAILDPKVFLTDCDWKQVQTALPLAALRVSGQLFWVLEEHGWEHEVYVIAEVGPSGVRYLIEVSGGGC